MRSPIVLLYLAAIVVGSCLAAGHLVQTGRLGAVVSISISPDGKLVGFQSYGGEAARGIFVVDLKKVMPGATHPLSNPVGKTLVDDGRDIAWAADGRKFVFDRGASGPGSDDAASTLWVGQLESTKYRKIATGWMGAWSPDGKEVAFVRSRGLYAVALGTARERLIVSGSKGRGLDVVDPAWSPDGRSIVYGGHEDGALWSVDPKGGKPYRMTEASDAKADMEPAFSPDGRYLVFTRGHYLKARSSEGLPVMLTHQLYLLDLGNRRLSQLTELSEGRSDTSPQWLPDGKTVAFVRHGHLAFVSALE